MKRSIIAVSMILCMELFTFCVNGEGFLPSLTDTIGKPMPSLGEALGRYPDEEISGEDGSSTEVFHGITETDFNTFSVYLSEKGAALADYQAAGSSFSATIRVEGKTVSFTYDTKSLEATMTYPKGTYDEWLEYAKTRYKTAVQLLNAGKADEALGELTAITAYEAYAPAAGLLAESPELKAAAAAAAAREAKLKLYRTVGSYVTFGHYPQTAGGNDSTPIEWLVLDYDAANNRALLLSRYGLDAKPYNTNKADITWAECTLRSWLNGEFLKKAFSAAEQGAIETTTVDNSKSQGYWKTDGGKNTEDKVFLLSYVEANKYLQVTNEDSKNMKSRVSPTEYAKKQGAYTSSDNKTAEGAAAGGWWLRSPGFYPDRAAGVRADGSLNFILYVYRGSASVRPALWINLESEIF